MASIEKNPRDLREYRSLTLANSLRCVLVSDPETEISAASMNVHIGSIYEEIPGLAHYLEHMLFMGTEKYPQENSVSYFLSENAGESNAFTDHEDCNFYFKVSSDQLPPALDMFSQFFISPLFNESSMERELKSIDSEFHKNLHEDLWRVQQVLYTCFEAPIDHFSLGNSSTLNGANIRDKIIEFYSRLYSAHLMYLVVYGREGLDELEAVAQVFALIPSKTPELKSFAAIRKKKPGISQIVPVKDSKYLKLIWNVRSCVKDFETKPEGYLGHLLGHEGKGSILSLLKQWNLAEELCSCYNEDFSFCGFFSVEVKLTEKGLRRADEVAEVVFAYLKMLRDVGAQEFVFEELKQIAWAQFLFRNKRDPYDFAQKLSSRMAKYPVEKILTGPELYFKFSEVAVEGFLEQLAVENLQIFLIAKEVEGDGMEKEEYFGTAFRYSEIGDQWMQRMMNPRDLPLHLPQPNTYIPDIFDVLPLSPEKLPIQLAKTDRFVLHFKQDSKFKIDKVYGQVIIHCSAFDFGQNPHFFMCAKMWEKLLCESLREEAYLADIAGLKHDIEVDNHGVRVSLNGFSQKYSKFFYYLIKKISSFKASLEDTSSFNDSKNELLTSIANCYFSKPTVQIQRVIYELTLQGGYFSQLEKLRVLYQITIEDLVWFSDKFLETCYFNWFIMGNISKSDALELAQTCTDTFFATRKNLFSKDDFLQLKVTKVPKSKEEFFILPLTDTNNTNSAVASLYQIGPETVRDECLISLVESYLEEPFFDQLRTKEQVGYVVSSYSHKMRGIFHFVFLVQSSTHSPDDVFNKISGFVNGVLNEIREVSEKKFAKLKKSTVETSLKKDLSLYEEFQRLRHEVDSAAFCFDRKKKLKEMMAGLVKEDFIEFCEKIFGQGSRKINVCLVSSPMEKTTEGQRQGKVFKGLKEFRRAHNTWSQVHTFSSII